MMRKYRVLRSKPAVMILAGLLLCLLVGILGEGAKAAGAYAASEKRPIYSVENGKSEVSIGINCAWGNEDIPDLLRILREHGVRATFFIVGNWCDEFPESVKIIHEAGHEIGSHSDTHADMTKLGDDDILREIRDSAGKLSKVTGVPVKLFRVPSGAYNSRVIELIEQEGMYPIQWDCEGMDMKTLNPTRGFHSPPLGADLRPVRDAAQLAAGRRFIFSRAARTPAPFIRTERQRVFSTL